MPLSTGQILHHRYRIARLLAQGGFGAVYKAWDNTLNIPCAVKESFELSPQGQRILQNFKSTLKIAGRPLSPDEQRQVILALFHYVLGEEDA